MQPTLIIISGPPGTGKTSLGKLLSDRYSIPFISKDDLKEILFDSLGWSDREWSKKVGTAGYSLLYYMTKQLLLKDQFLIIESNFHSQFDTPILKKILENAHASCLEIYLSCNGDILLERFQKRAANPSRHPGHVDQENLDEYKKMLQKGKGDKLELGGKVIEIDTTQFSPDTFTPVFEEIEKLL